MSDRDNRRWARFRTDFLTESTLVLLGEDRKQPADLIDLSPGGLAIVLPARSTVDLQPQRRIRLRLGFRGIPKVVLPALVLGVEPFPDGRKRVAMRWIQDPPAWDGNERRASTRLEMVPDVGFSARIQNDHLLGLWTRVAIIDISPDRDLRIEGVGGPIWMLPGMQIDVRLDLPILHDNPLRCQVLWVRPDETGRVQSGLRVLDVETPTLLALDEWISMKGLWSPRELVSRGFTLPTVPGQFQYRSAEALRDRVEVRRHLEACALRDTQIGFEPLVDLPEDGETNLCLIGCREGPRLVASVALDLTPERRGGSPGGIELCVAGFELDWFEAEILRGLWNHIVRIFLTTSRDRLLVWSPPGRERIFSMLGLRPMDSGFRDGRWFALERNTVMQGSGVSPFIWVWIYGKPSGFHARQGAHLSWRNRLARMVRQGIDGLFSEIMLPKKLERMGLELRRWCEEATRF